MSEYQRTLRLNVDEECDGSFTLHWSAQKRRLDGKHTDVADLLGLGFSESGTPVPTRITSDLEELHRRIVGVATRNGFSVNRTGLVEWFVTARVRVRKRHRFPTPAGDGVKFGPTNFYPQVWRDLVTAFRSGLDFSTGWMGAKKESLSVQISREKGRVWVEVSTSIGCDEDGNGGGLGKVSSQIHKALPLPEIERRLDRAGFRAWELAKDDLRNNSSEFDEIDWREV